MKTLKRNLPVRTTGVLTTLCLWAAVFAAAAQEPAAAWPRRSAAPPVSVALYEPQVESYDREWMTARAAVSVVVNGAEPVFGAVWFGMRLSVNAEGTLGRVNAVRLDQMRFPTDDLVETTLFDRLLGSSLIGAELPLEPLLASLARDKVEAEAAAAGNQAVPDILFTTTPVALVRIDGEPELQGVPDLDLLAVINSNTPIFLQKGTSVWFMQVDGRWLQAAAVTGPWQDADGVPDSVKKAVAASDPAAASTSARPQIVVVTRPTEVVTTAGEPRYAVIPGTGLLYVKNTEADLFLDIAGQRHYALLAGRWFATANPQSGPWEVVPGAALPSGFARIPEGSPKYGLLAHVPGTSVAKAAVQDAEVPRTQAVRREVTTLAVAYEGEPEFAQAGSTTVYYAVNTPYSVLRLDPYYYLCYSGVWYYGGTAAGPWSVCANVPGVIYTIPPACPVYPVTYVRVYDSTPDVVYCGYTSGYLGWYVGGSSLLFGLAYYDDAWWGRRNSRYYYHQNYRCGYYPVHGPYGSDRPGWGPPPPRPGGPLGPPPPFVPRRPGPEYHLTVNLGPRAPVGPSHPEWTPSRPNRYDQEPTSALAQQLHGNPPPAGGHAGMPDRTPPGRPDRTPPGRPDRTPPGRDAASRDPNPVRPAPERAERTPTGRDAASRDLRSDRPTRERPDGAPAERAANAPTATERTDRTTPAPQPLIRREPRARDERTDRTSTAPQPLIRSEPATRDERPDRATSAPQREPRVAPTRPVETRTADPAPQPEPRATPAPQREPRVAPTRPVETRTADPAPQPAPRATPAPQREPRVAPTRPVETRTADPAPQPEPRATPAPQREPRVAPTRPVEAAPVRPSAPAAPAARVAPTRERAAPADPQVAPPVGGATPDGRDAQEGVPGATRRSPRGR
jgi:hypothetical protein